MTLRAAIRLGAQVAARTSTVARGDVDGRPRTPAATILARITGATAIGSNKRWRYTWVEAELDGSHLPQDRTGGLTSATSGEALNVADIGNNGTTRANGVVVANLPGTFDSVQVDGYVELTPRRRSTGALYWTFTAAIIDGLCT